MSATVAAITGEERELFARSIDHATASATGAELDVALADLGWSDALEMDPQTAVSLLFEAQGRANASSASLDAVLATSLGLDAGTRVVLPAVGSVEAPGSVVDGSVQVAGLVTGPLDGPVAVVAADGNDVTVVVVVDGADLAVADPTGIDGASPIARASGLVGLDRAEPADWEHAVAAGQRALAHELIGSAAAMLDLARQHALERVQFGQPIAKFQAIRHKLAECHVAVASARSALDGAWLEATPFAAACVKAVAGRNARLVAKHAQQILAGIGFTLEHDLHRHVRRTLVLEGLLGDTSSLTEATGRHLLATRDLPPGLPL